MMKKVLLLATAWQEDYWESGKEAPYPKTEYTALQDWDDLVKCKPLPGLGIYIKQKENDFRTRPFVYLKVNGMGYDQCTKHPYFDFEPIKPSRTESGILEEKLSKAHRKLKLFSTIEADKLLAILKDIGEEVPEAWLKLMNFEQKTIFWKDYLGKYFLEIAEVSLSNDEFENRVYELLTALGLNVEQKGHRTPGEYPDGIASFNNDYAIVYDCKNTQNFAPTAEDERAINKYLSDEKMVRKKQKIFCAFIAKSFKKEQGKRIFYLSTDALLYLLYKKMRLGTKFTLAPLKKVLQNFMLLDMSTIDKEWMN